MEVSAWLGQLQPWLDLLQTIGIIGGLFFSAYALRQTAESVRRDEESRRIGNLIAVKQQYHDIWQEMYERPTLFRVLKSDVDLTEHPPSDTERLFIKMLLLHLDTVHRAIKADLFAEIKGIKDDIGGFIELPIPKAVWEQMKPFQDEDFVRFVEACQVKR